MKPISKIPTTILLDFYHQINENVTRYVKQFGESNPKTQYVIEDGMIHRILIEQEIKYRRANKTYAKKTKIFNIPNLSTLQEKADAYDRIISSLHKEQTDIREDDK